MNELWMCLQKKKLLSCCFMHEIYILYLASDTYCICDGLYIYYFLTLYKVHRRLVYNSWLLKFVTNMQPFINKYVNNMTLLNNSSTLLTCFKPLMIWENLKHIHQFLHSKVQKEKKMQRYQNDFLQHALFLFGVRSNENNVLTGLPRDLDLKLICY